MSKKLEERIKELEEKVRQLEQAPKQEWHYHFHQPVYQPYVPSSWCFTGGVGIGVGGTYASYGVGTK